MRRKQYEYKEEYDKSAYNANSKDKLAKKLGAETKKADAADSAYQESVQKQQELETKCWHTEVPSAVAELEEIEKLRVECMKSAFENYINLERGFPPILTEGCEKISLLVSAINASADVQLFVDQKKTSKQKPPLTTYEPYNEALGKCVPSESAPPTSSSYNDSGTSSTVSRDSSISSRSSPSPSSPSPSPKAVGKARALFDYTAQSDHELSFRAGDVITIIEKDDSGWWHGELSGKLGIFPAADWVEEISNDEPPSQFAGKKCKAIYSYEAQDEEELSITEGEILSISSEVYRPKKEKFAGT